MADPVATILRLLLVPGLPAAGETPVNYRLVRQSLAASLEVLHRDLGPRFVALYGAPLEAALAAAPQSSATSAPWMRGVYRAHGTGYGPIYSAYTHAAETDIATGLGGAQATLLAALLVHVASDSISRTRCERLAGAINSAFVARRGGAEARLRLSRFPARAALGDLREFAADAAAGSLRETLLAVVAGLAAALPPPTSTAATVDQPASNIHSRPSPIAAPPSPRVAPAPRGLIARTETSTAASVLTGPMVAPTPEDDDQANATATPAADLVPSSTVVVVSTEQRSYLAARTQSRRLGIHLRAGAWAPVQWDALARFEMTRSLQRWVKRAELALATDDLSAAEAALVVLLAGCLGWSPERIWHCDRGAPVTEPEADHIDWRDGVVKMQIPRGRSAHYSPAKYGHADLVRPVENRVTLALPLEVATLVSRLGHAGRWPIITPLPTIIEHVRKIQRVDRRHEMRETLARLRNGHLVRLLTNRGDHAVAQILAGDLLGADDVALCYVAVPTDWLQNRYDEVIRDHGLTPSAAPNASRTTWVGGSQLQISADLARNITRQLRAGHAQASGHDRTARPIPRLLREHDRYVASLACLLTAGLLIRPNDSISSLRTTNFCVRARCAIIADKRTDEGHLGRLLPIPSVLAESLRAYIRHLRSLSAQPRMPRAVVSAAQAAIAGNGPLLFVASDDVAPISVSHLQRRWPTEHKLPLNVWRHRYASELRLQGCPPQYVEAMLGHVVYGIQPFGLESLTCPREYLRRTGEAMDSVLATDGWGAMYGMADVDDDDWPFQPLSEQTLRLRPDHEAAIARIRADRARAIDAAAASSSEQAQRQVDEVISTYVPSFQDAANGKIGRALAYAIRRAILDRAESVAHATVMLRALRAAYDDARQRGWSIAGHPYALLCDVEATPHANTYPGVYETFGALRDWWMSTLEDGSPASSDPLTRAIVALILWHGVTQQHRLQAILRSLRDAKPCSGLPDALLVPCRHDDCDEDEAEVLRGAVALAVAPLVGSPQPENAIAASALDRLIRAAVPRQFVTSGVAGQSLLVLLEAAAIVHTMESPPPVRDFRCGKISAVGLPARRVERLLSSAAVVPVATSSRASERERGRRDLPRSHLSIVRAAYSGLRDVLRVRRGRAKDLPHQGITLSPTTPSHELRAAMLADLELHAGKWASGGDSVPALLCAYARHLLEHGTEHSERVEPSTVYGYVVGAGGALTRIRPDTCPAAWDADDVYDAYCETLSAVSPKYRPSVARYLTYFHQYLVATHGAEPIDLRAHGGDVAGRPDVEVISPREHAAAVRHLATAADAEAIGSVYETEVAADVLRLGYATGARSSELVGRELREFSCHPNGLALIVRGNRFGRVKTTRAMRVIPLDGWLAPNELSSLGERVIRRSGGKQSHLLPLFPDRSSPTLPVPLDTIQSLVGQALRAATGESNARQYSLRHTAASVDFVLLFADPSLARSLTATQPPSLQNPGPPSALNFRSLLGGSTELTLIHAAAYRARRGHASLATSITHYVHSMPLLLTPGTAMANGYLSASAAATMLGRKTPSVRRAVERALGTAARGSAFAAVLLGGSLDRQCRDTDRVAAPVDDPPITAITIESVVQVVTDYYARGDATSAAGLLRGTKSAQRLAAEALEQLRIQPPREPSAGTADPLAPAALGPILSHPIATRHVDVAILRALTTRMQGAAVNGPMSIWWEWVAARYDPASRLMRWQSPTEMATTVAAMMHALPPSLVADMAIVHAPGVDMEAIRAVLAKAHLTPLPMRPDRSALSPGHLRAALRHTAAPRHRYGTWIVAAATWRLWSRFDQSSQLAGKK